VGGGRNSATATGWGTVSPAGVAQAGVEGVQTLKAPKENSCDPKRVSLRPMSLGAGGTENLCYGVDALEWGVGGTRVTTAEMVCKISGRGGRELKGGAANKKTTH